MNSSTRAALLAALVLVFVAAGCASRPPVMDISEFAGSLVEQVQNSRELKFDSWIDVKRLSAAEFAAYGLSRVDEAELAAEEKTLRKFGFVDRSFQMKRALEDLMEADVAALYNTRDRELIVKSDKRPSEMEELLLHELTHALQDQRFNVRDGLNPNRAGRDASLALRALLEGDALGVQKGGPVQLNDSCLAAFGRKARSGGMPRVIAELMLFPYASGGRWIRTAWKKGGYDLVNRAMSESSDRIASTEQILHPEKYFDASTRDLPKRVELPRFANVLPGMRPVQENNLGEFYTRVLLAGELDEEWAAKAAAGWDGDQYQVLEDRDNSGEMLLLWYTTWDSENEAEEFFEGYSYFTACRNTVPTEMLKSGTNPLAVKTLGGWIHIERRGSSVAVIDGAAEESLQRLQSLIWSGTRLREAAGAGGN